MTRHHRTTGSRARASRPIVRRAAAAAAAGAIVATALTATAGPAEAAASCEFRTYQYVVTGESVSLWTRPEGQVKAILRPGDVVNSSLPPDQTGWLIGNAYTASRQPIDSGWVLRHWTSYTGSSWC